MRPNNNNESIHCFRKNITNLSCYNFDKRESVLSDRLLNGSPTVCKPVRPMISDPLSVLSVSLSVLSVTLVYCGQTVEQIKMKLGMQVDLDHNALDGDPVPPERGTPHFRPMSVAAKWLNGLKCHLVWRYASAQATLCYMGTQLSPQKRAQPPPANFRPCLLWPNGWMHQVPLIGAKVGRGPGDIVLDADPAPPKRSTALNFQPMSIVAKGLDGSRCYLVRR